MKRAFIAVLAFFVVGSALGQSPAEIRITTWNLEWFPNGSPHETALEKQAQRIEAAANVLKETRCRADDLGSSGDRLLRRAGS
jgi:hypothetical protein